MSQVKRSNWLIIIDSELVVLGFEEQNLIIQLVLIARNVNWSVQNQDQKVGKLRANYFEACDWSKLSFIGCTHPCTIQKCHPGECPDCVSILKIRCHCTLTNVFVKCSQYLMSSRLELETLLCCKDQCPKMLECGHRCTKTCHTGRVENGNF